MRVYFTKISYTCVIAYKEVKMDINKIMTNRVDNISQQGLTNNRIKPDISSPEQNRSGTDFKLTGDNVNNLVDALNSAARSVNQRVSFSFNEETNRVIMKVIDSGTNEVVREIPPKEMIRLLKHMHDLIGMFVDESR